MQKERLVFLLLLFVVVPIGFYTKIYSGPAEHWIRNSMGGLVYEIFWCLLIAFLLPRLNPLKIALWVFFVTCALEFLQLWHPPFLETVRLTFLGRTLLGHSFNVYDFPYYFFGSLTGWALVAAVKNIASPEPPTSGRQ